MTDLEAVLRQAQDGNVEAMLALTSYYMNTERSHADAMKWADAAADAGSASGCMLSAHLHFLTAQACCALGSIDSMAEECQFAYNRAIIIRDALDQNILKWDHARTKPFYELWNEIRYHLALSMSYQADFKNGEQVIPLLVTVPMTKAEFLLGVCNFRMEKYSETYSCLNRAFQDQDYAVAEKDTLEEGVYADGLHSLSLIYRIGIPGYIHCDLSKAVDVLNRAIATVKDPDFCKKLHEELNHYHKKLFGGYKYV